MSKVEVNQISSQCGSTLTIGQSGDTVTLAAGATQTGFGRTGTVDWDTTAKTASFTAVSGNGYFVNTTSAAITLTLPASPSAGDIVSFKDYAFTFATNNLTVDGNGSPIGGVDGTQGPKYSTNGTSKTFIYVDGTKGWLVTNESTDTSQESTPTFIVATGGTITCCGDYKIHTFTGPGTFTVCSVGNPFGSNSVDYLVVAGGAGGAGANDNGVGGGGAGGYRESSGTASGCYSVSPLGACVSALPVSAQGYPITVGGGGSGGAGGTPIGCIGGDGSNSIFSTITSAGGGGGGNFNQPPGGNDGGSGGGGPEGPIGPAIGAGNTPPVSPPQGNPGGIGHPGAGAGGGGGATAAGGAGTGPGGTGGPGGAGATTSISFSPTAYAGGGGGGIFGTGPGGVGGTGGGGNGRSNSAGVQAGTTNTGGGGGGAGGTPTVSSGGAGGSGIVIIRYKYQ
jgi:hypothetical protein